jgi:phosphatidate cytidylyltransferase
MIINNYILGFFLLTLGILSILEFFKINLILHKKNKFLLLITNLIFIFYIAIFCGSFLMFSDFFHLKIIIFTILLTCAASDMGGFICGKIFKGPKLTKISPNKTITGSLGSFVFSTGVLLFLINYLTNTIDLTIVIVGLMTSLGAQLGDLFFSYLKRKSNLKDTGNFLPGHGGILDRVDGILLGMPIGFLTLLLIY